MIKITGLGLLPALFFVKFLRGSEASGRLDPKPQERPPRTTVSDAMKKLLKFLKPLRDFFIKHPAVLSGYIIYAYFFITTMDFYRDIKLTHFKAFNLFERFDALIWMWLLAVVLVKVIEYRNRINAQEKLRLEHLQELEVKKTQLLTAQEMIRSLQHEINNPLTIIFLHLQRALRDVASRPKALENLTRVREGAERIATTLREFSNAQGIQTVESPVGKMAKPVQDDGQAPGLDEAGSA
jgi:signal transduction histidine kinase